MAFVVTNYFIRFLLNDINSQHLEAKKAYLKRGIKLFTSLLVIFEIYWVFTSFYEKGRPEIINILRDVLKLSFIELPERGLLGKLLDIYEKSPIEFEYSYNIVYAKVLDYTVFATFDKKLQKERE